MRLEIKPVLLFIVTLFAVSHKAWYSSVSRLPFSHFSGVITQVLPPSQPRSPWLVHISFVIPNTDPQMDVAVQGVSQRHHLLCSGPSTSINAT